MGPSRKPGASLYTLTRLSLPDELLSNFAFKFNLRRYMKEKERRSRAAARVYPRPLVLPSFFFPNELDITAINFADTEAYHMVGTDAE
jgi:hypothetical protein